MDEEDEDGDGDGDGETVVHGFEEWKYLLFMLFFWKKFLKNETKYAK
jgi:hypothetical protein